MLLFSVLFTLPPPSPTVLAPVGLKINVTGEGEVFVVGQELIFVLTQEDVRVYII